VDELNIVLLKKIAIYDLMLAMCFIGLGYFFISSSSLFFLLGIFFAWINLAVNSLATNFLLLKEGTIKRILGIGSNLFRILLVCVTGIIIITKNDLNFIIYIIGYTAQLISIVLYGIRDQK
jgi:ATP synthase protein I